ncbi:hypothetical protein AX14_012745 [Amanita brunnescens Koide BX004]|nr:hypothetical protein AX14_012745 [Amanita brunnescens Koide BX004]
MPADSEGIQASLITVHLPYLVQVEFRCRPQGPSEPRHTYPQYQNIQQYIGGNVCANSSFYIVNVSSTAEGKELQQSLSLDRETMAPDDLTSYLGARMVLP